MAKTPYLLLAAFPCVLVAQTTTPAPGLTYFDPSQTASAMLLDGATNNVHTWTFAELPIFGSYLDRDGNVLRAYRTGAPGPGVGGAVQRVAFDGTVLWDYTPPGPGYQHHDIQEMANGHVLLAMTDPMTAAQMASLGRDPLNTTPVWTSERIIEVEPTGPTTGNVVWEWRAIDHLVQHFDSTAPDYDVIAARPERIDVNYPALPNSALWMHINGIDYNEQLDQIAISCRNWSEMWVLDHSTTTAEAAGSTGGLRGHGGDLLYRWGNPAAYQTPGLQQLNGQHDVTWIRPGRQGAGHFLCFNNVKGALVGLGSASAITEWEPPVDALGNYSKTPGAAFLPVAPTWEYFAPVPHDLYAGLQSGAERLPNGNTLVCSSQGIAFELGLNDQIVWQAIVPQTFKARRYEFSLWQGADEVSASAGGVIPFDLVPGTMNAGNVYFLGGSISGTSPGFPLGGFTIPLNPDIYLANSAGTALLPGSIGFVNANGTASASFSLPPGIGGGFLGTVFSHAYLVLDVNTFAITHVSNPRGLTMGL